LTAQLPASSWKNASSRGTACPFIAAARPETSCGTIHVYVALEPCAKPTSVDGVKPGCQEPSARRARW
jgi:hypothetical protein